MDIKIDISLNRYRLNSWVTTTSMMLNKSYIPKGANMIKRTFILFLFVMVNGLTVQQANAAVPAGSIQPSYKVGASVGFSMLFTPGPGCPIVKGVLPALAACIAQWEVNAQANFDAEPNAYGPDVTFTRITPLSEPDFPGYFGLGFGRRFNYLVNQPNHPFGARIINGYISLGGAVEDCPDGYAPFFDAATVQKVCAPITQRKTTRENTGKNPCNGSNPINSYSGNKYQREVDYTGTGPFPLTFVRHYNSRLTDTHIVGINWSHTYSSHINSGLGAFVTQRAHQQTLDPTNPLFTELEDAYVADPLLFSVTTELHRPDGTVLQFSNTYNPNTQSTATVQWQGPVDITAKLETLTVAGTITGFKYSTNNDTVEVYDLGGRLTSITNRAGVTQTLSYNASNQLISVADPFGRSLSFSYDANGRLQRLTDPDNQITNYGYDTLGNLTSVTYPDTTTTRQYAYEALNNPNYINDPNILTGIIDENGNRFATWTYDTQGRAISSEHAGSVDRVTFSYSATLNTTIVTNALGQQQTLHFALQDGVARLTQIDGGPCNVCGGQFNQTSYDANGFINSRTDFNGNRTTFINDSRGLQISRTEATGTPVARTITTDWHPTFRLPIKITEPGKVTNFTYDANGRLLARQEQATQ